MQIKIDGDVFETDEYTVAQLETLLEQIANRCDALTSQWMEASARRATTGQAADPDWFRRLTLARKKSNQMRQKLMVELGRRRKAEKRALNYQSELPKYFVRVAQEYISAPLFDRIMEEANRRYSATQAGQEENRTYVFEVGE